MFREKDWKFPQASRLEIQRHEERQARQAWFDELAAKWEELQQQEWDEAQEWGSWWWSPDDPSWGSDWWTQGEAWQSGLRAGPTAEGAFTERTAGAASSSSQWLPPRSPEEDKAKLRDATITPASFMPQRWITMALGRPVVVLRGYANPLCQFTAHTCIG